MPYRGNSIEKKWGSTSSDPPLLKTPTYERMDVNTFLILTLTSILLPKSTNTFLILPLTLILS